MYYKNGVPFICVLFGKDINLLVLFGSDPGVGIGHSDGQLLRALDQSLSVLGGNSVSDLGAELLVLHHQDFQFLKK